MHSWKALTVNSNRICMRLTMQGSHYSFGKAQLLWDEWNRNTSQLRNNSSSDVTDHPQHCSMLSKVNPLNATIFLLLSSCLLCGCTCLRSVRWLCCHYSSVEGSAPSHRSCAQKQKALRGDSGFTCWEREGIESAKSPCLSVLFCSAWMIWSLW